jgi:hypothetical protein
MGASLNDVWRCPRLWRDWPVDRMAIEEDSETRRDVGDDDGDEEED